MEHEYVHGNLGVLAPREVDRVVRAHLLKLPGALDVDSNVRHFLEGLQDKVLREAFERVRTGESPSESLDGRLYRLCLLGAIKRDQGRFVVRNRIYQELTSSTQIEPSVNQHQDHSLAPKRLIQLLILRPLHWLGQMTRKIGGELDNALNIFLGVIVIVLILLFVFGIFGFEELKKIIEGLL